MTAILNKKALASQPTLSRFYNRMDSDTLGQFDDLNHDLRRTFYSIQKPEFMLFDIDSTLDSRKSEFVLITDGVSFL